METNKVSIEESGLTFEFNEGTLAVKFDDGAFYRSEFNKSPESKGVDILADDKKVIQLIEIKNCIGHERENMWRTSINNSKVESAPHDLDVRGRESLDIEIAKKVVSTLVCLYGAWSKSESSEKARELETYWKGIFNSNIPKDKKKILVILFLEGDFNANGPKSRSKKMIMRSIQESINTKLAWLKCQVSVVDSDTYKERYFTVRCAGNGNG